MSYKFGPGEYRTSAGRKAIVEFVMNEPHAGQPLVGQAQFHDGSWNHCMWGLDGTFFTNGEEASWDLVPPKREVWGVFCASGSWHSGSSDIVEASQRASSINGSFCLMREADTASEEE